MVTTALILAIIAAPSCSEHDCPVGSHLVGEVGAPVCPPCRPDSPSELCRCTEGKTDIRCALGAPSTKTSAKGGRDRSTSRSTRDRARDTPTPIGRAQHADYQVTQIASGVSLDYGFAPDGSHAYHSKGRRSLGKGSSTKPTAADRAPSSVLSDEDSAAAKRISARTEIPLTKLHVVRVSPRYAAVWVDRRLHAFDFEYGRLEPIEGAVDFKWFAAPVPGQPSVVYIAQDGVLYLANIEHRTAKPVGAEGPGETSPFFVVSSKKNGIAYALKRPSGVGELHFASLADEKDVLLTTFCGSTTTVVKDIPNSNAIAAHINMGSFQILVEADVKTNKVLLAASPKPSWSNIYISPDGRHMLFGVMTKTSQPRELDLFLVKRR